MSGLPSERTPLLDENASAHEQDKNDEIHEVAPKETPIPWGQFSITLVLQLAEPMSSQVIYPFVPQLIRETGITGGDDKKVAYYVGIMQSIFFATQALTVLHWSRISDRVGRKPVILIGLAGLSLSMFCFGLARSFPALVVARSLNGLLNGMIGVIKSMMGELTDSTNIARAYAYQPISWSTGATIGPLIGGALSHPAERFPGLFSGNKFLETYPYFLPCAIPAGFCIVAWTVTFGMLRETNPTGFSFRTLLPLALNGNKKHDLDSESLKSVTTSMPSAPPLRSLLTGPVLLSTASYALLSLLDIAYRALQPVFYSLPRSLGGLGLEPHTIGIFLAALGLANGVFQVSCFARLIKMWGERGVYLVGIGSAIPIFLLYPAMSAVVRAEDRNRTMSDDSEGDISWVLGALVAFQLALTLLLNMCYGSVFIFITAAANAIPLKSKRKGDQLIRPAVSSSSSSATLVPSSSLSPSRSRKSTATKNGPKKGKKTLGAVNGLAQCSVSVMRCVGPYSASALFAKGLTWQYGDGAGDDIPLPLPGGGGDGEPISDALPTLGMGSMQEWAVAVEKGLLWRTMGGLMVYAVMIALVVLTLIVGSHLPKVPWTASVDDDDDDDDVSAVSEVIEGGLEPRNP